VLQLKLGIQLECLKLPFRQALRAAAEMGVHAVEINARSELRPDELTRTGVRHVRKLLADLNLAVCSIQFPTRRGYGDVQDLEKRIDSTKQAMTAAFELGARVVVNPISGIPENAASPEWPIWVQALTDLGRHGHRVGAWLAARTGSDGSDRLANLIDALPSGMLGVDFDPGSLIINGHSPEAAMRRLADHVVSFRAFDAARDSSGRGMHVQFGRGSVDFPMLFSILEEKHYNGYVVVERQVDRDSIASCQQTIEFLRRLF
jgi:sugar phosphate isomerase/epimerase